MTSPMDSSNRVRAYGKRHLLKDVKNRTNKSTDILTNAKGWILCFYKYERDFQSVCRKNPEVDPPPAPLLTHTLTSFLPCQTLNEAVANIDSVVGSVV